ncbi:DNA helicase MCM8 [Nematocida major]|uniref:DNA helicase MCM8 n=1 Tax=Nematocida major TaxID=1912982 RepID=UPI002007840B|nr:DNA helicase MCM8 [Nematocida major]KAH9385478.1 DNA helicase MCM8 [Nematocida major]
MEYARLYFQGKEEIPGLVETFYTSMQKKLRAGAISVSDIESGLEVDMFYLEKHLKEVTSFGIDHLRAALTRIVQQAKGVLAKAHIKIVPFPEPVPFSTLRHSSVGRVFSLVGVVSKIESAKPIPISVRFMCNKCNAEIEHMPQCGLMEKPEQCISPCKSKFFTLLADSPKNVFKDHQRVKIQELFLTEIERRKAGSINCILEQGHVNTLLPGDAVHVLGMGVAEDSAGDGYTVGIKANNISFLKQKDMQSQCVFLPADIQEIKALSRTEGVVDALAEALFGEIVGHSALKKGILMSLVGGSYKKHKRKEIHLVAIGDPGMGKSKLIRIASEILPRSNYICGATTTPGGLGLTMQSGSSGEFTLAAGALVLSDLGHCFVDELDKLNSPQVLFEAMESEEVTIAKAGIVCAMPARTSVIAAANPLCGRYRKDKTLAENLNLPDEFLSRFDLIFVMLDEAGGAEHRSITQRILEQGPSEESSQKTPRCLAQKYIQYARDQVSPVLSSSAKESVVAFFTTIRQEKVYKGRILPQPLTPRVVDSVARIAEALAKLHLRKIATKSDVEHAIEIITVDKAQVQKKPARKEPPHAALMRRIQETQSSEISEKDAQALGESLGLDRELVNRLIYKFNQEGLLIKKGGGIYRIKM